MLQRGWSAGRINQHPQRAGPDALLLQEGSQPLQSSAGIDAAVQLRSIALPERQLPLGSLQIKAARPFVRRLIGQWPGQETLDCQSFRLKAMQRQAGHSNGVNPAIQAVLAGERSQPATAARLQAQAGLSQWKRQLQGRFLRLEPRQKRVGMTCCCQIGWQLQQPQHHRRWRHQRCGAGGLDAALEQQITDEIAQGLRLLRYSLMHQIWSQGDVLPTEQLQTCVNAAVLKHRELAMGGAEGHPRAIQGFEQLLPQGGQPLGKTREHPCHHCCWAEARSASAVLPGEAAAHRR